jgi:hypothetical protein
MALVAASVVKIDPNTQIVFPLTGEEHKSKKIVFQKAIYTFIQAMPAHLIGLVAVMAALEDLLHKMFTLVVMAVL